MPITIDEVDALKDWVCQRPGNGCPTPFSQTIGNVIPVAEMPNTSVQTAVGLDPVAWKRFIVNEIGLSFAAPPSGTVSTPYTRQLTVDGGSGPYTWSVSVGTLPTGITLNAGTGLLSGTPTAAGTSNFTVRVVDVGGQAATKTVALVIAS